MGALSTLMKFRIYGEIGTDDIYNMIYLDLPRTSRACKYADE